MTIRGPIDAGVAGAIVPALQDTMIDLFDLSITGKAHHWSVQNGAAGAAFLPVHRALDELVEWARDEYDTVAERIIQLGAFPDARAATIATRTPLVQIKPGALPVEECIRQTAAAIQVVDGRVRKRMDECTRDLVTQNIFIDIVQELEKLSWFWQASIAS